MEIPQSNVRVVEEKKVDSVTYLSTKNAFSFFKKFVYILLGIIILLVIVCILFGIKFYLDDGLFL